MKGIMDSRSWQITWLERNGHHEYTHTHWVGEIEYANIVENHHDAAGYDALYTVGREILKQITKTRDPGGIFIQLLHNFGRENSRAYVKYTNVDNPNLGDTLQSILIHHKPFEEFYERHKDEFVKRAVETTERLMGRKLTSEERQKIERAFELAVEYGKRFHDIYKNVSEDKYHQTAEASKTHHAEGYKSVEYAEKVLGIDFLDHVGDIILELNKLLPGFSKPEEVYGDRWYEFLKKKGIDPKTLEPIGTKPKYPETKKAVEEELRKAGVPEEKIYAELEKRGIPRDVAEKLVEKAHLLSPREVDELVRKHVDSQAKAKALLEAFERKGRVVPVPKYWANIVSKIATGDIRENELLEALAVSKVFHTAYSTAIAKAAKMDEPESVMQRMMFIKNVVKEAHREAIEALKDHPVYGEYVRRMAPAIEREMKEIAETLSKTYYAKARGDPTLSAREFLQMELNPVVKTLAPLRKNLKKIKEDFLALGKPQEETIAKIYPAIVKRLLCLALGKEVEKEYVGITLGHERIRLILNDIM